MPGESGGEGKVGPRSLGMAGRHLVRYVSFWQLLLLRSFEPPYASQPGKSGACRKRSIHTPQVTMEKENSIGESSTFLTTGKTHGFPLSSLYAPMPCGKKKRNVSKRARHYDHRITRTHQVDFVGALIGLVSSRESKKRILRSLRHGLGGETRYCWRRHVVCDVMEAGERS